MNLEKKRILLVGKEDEMSGRKAALKEWQESFTFRRQQL